MAAQIDYLLPDDADGTETIGPLIASIIKEESENQVSLSIAGGATPAEAAEVYELKVYLERWAPWDIWVNKLEGEFVAPVVNVWLETTNQDDGSSNQMSRQTYTGTWNIDVYGYGRSREDPDNPGTQIVADADANAQRNRGVRWVRKYLAAAKNIYLRQPKPGGFVWLTRVRTFEYFVPAVEDLPVGRVKAARISFDVTYNEFSPQAVEETLELASVDICTLDPATLELSLAKLAAEVDIEYPLP